MYIFLKSVRSQIYRIEYEAEDKSLFFNWFSVRTAVENLAYAASAWLSVHHQ